MAVHRGIVTDNGGNLGDRIFSGKHQNQRLRTCGKPLQIGACPALLRQCGREIVQGLGRQGENAARGKVKSASGNEAGKNASGAPLAKGGRCDESVGKLSGHGMWYVGRTSGVALLHPKLHKVRSKADEKGRRATRESQSLSLNALRGFVATIPFLQFRARARTPQTGFSKPPADRRCVPQPHS